MNKYLPIALLGLFVACGSPKSDKAELQATADASNAPRLLWQIERATADTTGYAPVSRLTLLINGKKEPLGEVNVPLEEIPAERFAEKGIPSEAALACGGFWGGSETNYYAVVKGKEIIVMFGGPNENEETADRQPFMYEVFKTFKWH